jgi:localization factor PodJL
MAIAYDRAMAEKYSPRRAQRLSRRRAAESAIELELAAGPSGATIGAATDPAARLRLRRPGWAVLAALTTIAVLLAVSIALLIDLARVPRAGNHPIAVALPVPAESPAAVTPPASTPAPAENSRAAADRDLARATEGDPGAQYAVALRFAEGRGVAKDYKRAAAWFREAAINGVAAAQYDLGLLYDRGLGVARDPIEAVIWFQSAADQNEPVAQLRLGKLYLAGDVVPRSPVEAARWLRRAAELGLAEAQTLLAARYEAGDGVAQSSATAYGWYDLAAAAGLGEAQLAKAKLATSLAPPELSEAESRAAKLAAQVPQHLTAAAHQDRDGLLVESSTTMAASGTVSRGMIGEIQRLLGSRGYDSGPADGFFGEQTTQAIRRYQQDVGMPVDGVPGLALLNRLRAAAAGPPPAAQP